MGIGAYIGFFNVSITNTTLELNHDIGITTVRGNEGIGPVGNLLLENVAIRNTRPEILTGKLGRGLNIYHGPNVTAKHSLFENNHDSGIMIEGVETNGTFENIYVLNTKSRQTEQDVGAGVIVRDHANAVFNQLFLNNNKSAAFSIVKNGKADILNAIITNTQSEEKSKTVGVGIDVQTQSILTLKKAIIEKNKAAGISLDGQGVTAILKDIIISKTLPQENEPHIYGLGILVTNNAHLTIERSIIEKNLVSGLFANNNSSFANST